MKRKLLPFLVFMFFFVAALTIQFGAELWQSNANGLRIEDARKGHYEKIYQEIKLDLSSGDSVKLSSLKEPIVVINFWASWCLPCLKEFDGLKSLTKTLGENNVKIIGINIDTENPKEKLKETEEKYSLNFKSVLDPENKFLDKFILTHIPASIIYHKGKVIYFNEKFTDYTDKKIVKELKGYL
ncbi:MAG: redoxin domain-containing protein [Halobacteriovoraceae bacterium]|nr:redoxin domain-containing protein [Halobacteriovoraceae bacterium]